MKAIDRIIDRLQFWSFTGGWLDAALCLRQLRKHKVYQRNKFEKWEVTSFSRLSPHEFEKYFPSKPISSKYYFCLSIGVKRQNPGLHDKGITKGITAYLDANHRVLDAGESWGIIG